MTILDGRKSYVAGQWVEGDRSFTVENPADESTVAEAGATPLSDVGRAIGEARRAFDEGTWAGLPAKRRAAQLRAFLDYLASSKDTLVDTMMAEAGQPRMYADDTQCGRGMTLARN